MKIATIVRGIAAAIVASLCLSPGLPPKAWAQTEPAAANTTPEAPAPLAVAARGAWSPTVSYKKDDLVTARGSTWRAKRENINKIPGLDRALHRRGLGSLCRRFPAARRLDGKRHLSHQRRRHPSGLGLAGKTHQHQQAAESRSQRGGLGQARRRGREWRSRAPGSARPDRNHPAREARKASKASRARKARSGRKGPAGTTLGHANFFALMPPDNAYDSGDWRRCRIPAGWSDFGYHCARFSSSSQFTLADVGTYQVMFQVSVSEAGQLVLTLNNIQLAYTAVGRATGTSQIVGMSLVQTTSANSVLTVRNAGSSSALTVTPVAGELYRFRRIARILRIYKGD